MADHIDVQRTLGIREYCSRRILKFGRVCKLARLIVARLRSLKPMQELVEG